MAILLGLSNVVLNYLGLANFIGLSNLCSLALTALALSAVFKILIHRKTSWKSLIVGNLATSFLLAVLRLVLQIYFTQSSFMSLYSAGGALVILLLWLNYNLQIIFLGLEITKNYQKKWS